MAATAALGLALLCAAGHRHHSGHSPSVAHGAAHGSVQGRSSHRGRHGSSEEAASSSRKSRHGRAGLALLADASNQNRHLLELREGQGDPLAAAVKEAEIAREAGLRARAALDAKWKADPRPFEPLGRVGVILNAYGRFKYFEEAMKVVDNLKKVWPSVKVLVWTSDVHSEPVRQMLKDYSGVSARFYESIHIPSVVRRCPGFQAPPPMFMAKIAALVHAYKDFDTSVVLDNDVHICEDIRPLLPTAERDYDVGTTVAPFGRWAGSGHDNTIAYNPVVTHADEQRKRIFRAMLERNVGVMVLRTAKKGVNRLLRRWADTFQMHGNNTLRCRHFCHEQAAFREALFTLRGEVREHIYHPDRVCRPGNQVAGCTMKRACLASTPPNCVVSHCRLGPMHPFSHKTRAELLKRK